mmetsp:Transcript_3329/g.5012  ORF Transcript_3329/g.5012 Transcript_3329/m.5012 type:complete len:175 (+) Transcript_3329:78-602(+)
MRGYRSSKLVIGLLSLCVFLCSQGFRYLNNRKSRSGFSLGASISTKPLSINQFIRRCTLAASKSLLFISSATASGSPYLPALHNLQKLNSTGDIIALRNKDFSQVVVVVGTIHISDEYGNTSINLCTILSNLMLVVITRSSQLVRKTIQCMKPTRVMIELDEKRIDGLGLNETI